MSEKKSAKTPADGPVAWSCQCGRPYTVTCISSKPVKQWVDCTDEQLIEEVRRRGFVIRDAQIEAPKQWVGLTDYEAVELVTRFARYELLIEVEAKLKEKNT